MTLTESWLKANINKVRDKKLIKSDRDGLNALVSPKGKIVFMFRYYYNGSRKDLDIASYPLSSLKEARAEVTRLVVVN